MIHHQVRAHQTFVFLLYSWQKSESINYCFLSLSEDITISLPFTGEKKTDGTNRVGVVMTDNPSSLIPLPSWTIPTLDNCHRHLQQPILLEMSKVGIVQSVMYLGSCP